MQIEESPAPPTPASAAASSSPDASQENDQSQANALGLPCAVGEPSAKQQETRHPARRRGGGAVWKARSRGKLAAACGSGGSTSCSSSKFVSPEAVLAAARELKDKLPEVSPELLERLKARGLEPCTLQQVLDERGLQWAATQILDERASAEHTRLLEAFQRQCKGWGSNREGWIHSRWQSVIVCPDFKRGGLQVSRSSMRDMWNSIMSVVSGFVNPDLLICRVTDPTHPVRFATPPNESCFTVVYAGKEPIRPSKDRRILGEYTGHIRQGKANEHRFEYVFDLSFCALAWRAAEEFEKDSDTSGDEGPPDQSGSHAISSACDGPKNGEKKTAVKGAEAEPSGEGKRRVQVTGSQNIKRVALPVRGELVLDSHDACNQMSLVNHYGTIGLLGERICHVNTEWQQVFVDGWPHIVLTTIPGVGIDPGDEVLADFGYDWFNRVQDASHKAIARELLDYRIGAKTGACQALAPARKAECVVRDSDESLQTRARMGEVCPYCHSDEILDASSPSKSVVKVSNGGGQTEAPKEQETQDDPTQAEAEGIDRASARGRLWSLPIWGEQVVHCDGCDRPCHLRCIFGAHKFDPQWQVEQQREYEQQRQNEQQHVDSADPAGSVSADTTTENGQLPSGTEAGDNEITSGAEESMENAYRWFVEGDCKWYCCVCRLQWERMAAAMNFAVDWKAREVLGAGNPLLLPTTDTAAKRLTSALQRSRVNEEQVSGDSEAHLDFPDFDEYGTKRRCPDTKRASAGSALSKRPKVIDASPHFTRRSKGFAGAVTEQDAHQAGPMSAVMKSEANASTTPATTTVISALGGQQEVGTVSEAAGVTVDVTNAGEGEALEKRGQAAEGAPEILQGDVKPPGPSDGLAGLSTATPESPISGADSEAKTLSGSSRGAVDAHHEGTTDIRSEDRGGGSGVSSESSHDKNCQGEEAPRNGDGLAFQQVMRVYKNSSEKARTSKMQPCPVVINPAELSSEELLGCRTEMLVEPRALLGSLQPCVLCYKLYGAKASVEVCRLTKRHLGSNWDHPDFTSPAQIQDALLTCFQDALLTLQREHREKLQQLFDTMSPLQREVNMKSIFSGNRYPRIHTNAARRSDANTQKEELRCTELVTKGVVPLLCVTLGKTRVDCQFPDPEDKKKLKWFYGCVTDYQAVVSEVKGPKAPQPARPPSDRPSRARKSGEKEEKITYYTNQFGIVYDDGDRQSVPPHKLIEMLIQTGPGSKLDGRKSITTTPLAKMLSPELKKANRQVNFLVRQTNRKGSSAQLDSDSDE